MTPPDSLVVLDIQPLGMANAGNLKRGLVALVCDDPQLAIYPSADERAITIGAQSDDQLERAVERLSREFGVAAAVGRLRIVYRDLTEPVMYVVIAVPTECVADVKKNLTERRGVLEPPGVREADQIIRATVPLAELLGYRSYLDQVTRGRGTFSQVLYDYRPISDPPLDPEVGVREPRPTSPVRRNGAISLAEPDPRTEGDPPS